MKKRFVMKRAKIILSALGVLAVIGSALAINARKAYTGPLRCTTTTLATFTTATVASCPQLAFVENAAGVWRYCTAKEAPANEPCFAKKVLFNQ
jgi:hypothetical protein